MLTRQTAKMSTTTSPPRSGTAHSVAHSAHTAGSLPTVLTSWLWW